MRPKTRIMYIESKCSDGIVGPAKIGRVKYSKSGKSIHYNGKTFQTLSGTGRQSGTDHDKKKRQKNAEQTHTL